MVVARPQSAVWMLAVLQLTVQRCMMQDRYSKHEGNLACVSQIYTFLRGLYACVHLAAEMLVALEREQERRRNARAAAAPGQATIAFERGAGQMGGLPASGSASNLQAAAAMAAAAAAAAALGGAGAGGGVGPGGAGNVPRPRPPAGPPGASALINAAALREQAAKTADALAAGARAKRSKWDAPR